MAKEGYLIIDHRASPGIPEDTARRMGLPHDQVAEGKVLEMATVRCNHCGTPYLKNPLRTRPRGHCAMCNSYICDCCNFARSLPDYVHRTFDQIAEMVMSGRYELSGSMSLPVLTLKGPSDG